MYVWSFGQPRQPRPNSWQQCFTGLLTSCRHHAWLSSVHSTLSQPSQVWSVTYHKKCEKLESEEMSPDPFLFETQKQRKQCQSFKPTFGFAAVTPLGRFPCFLFFLHNQYISLQFCNCTIGIFITTSQHQVKRARDGLFKEVDAVDDAEGSLSKSAHQLRLRGEFENATSHLLNSVEAQSGVDLPCKIDKWASRIYPRTWTLCSYLKSCGSHQHRAPHEATSATSWLAKNMALMVINAPREPEFVHNNRPVANMTVKKRCDSTILKEDSMGSIQELVTMSMETSWESNVTL